MRRARSSSGAERNAGLDSTIVPSPLLSHFSSERSYVLRKTRPTSRGWARARKFLPPFTPRRPATARRSMQEKVRLGELFHPEMGPCRKSAIGQPKLAQSHFSAHDRCISLQASRISHNSTNRDTKKPAADSGLSVAALRRHRQTMRDSKLSAWRTAGACGPSSDRTSCAPPYGRRA